MARESSGGMTLEARMEKVEKFLRIGKEDRFILAWGRLFAYAAQQRWTLVASLLVNVLMTFGLVVLAIRYAKREPWVFVKDNLGNVVQVDPKSFLQAGDPRDQNEVKAFAIEYVRDAFEFNPLNVKDKLTYALQFVDSSAQGAARNACRLPERAELVDRNFSVKVENEPDKGRIPQASVLSWDPLKVLVVVSRISVDSSGLARSLPPLAIQLTLRQVTRSPQNGHGLLITDISSTTN